MTLAQQYIETHFWPLKKAAAEEYPCKCSDPAHCDEGSFWECSHGRWDFYETEADLPHNKPEHSADECLGNCSQHCLLTGAVLELHLAALCGKSWGDVMYDAEQAELAAETPAQRDARVAKRAAADFGFKKAAVDEILRSKASMVKARPLNKRFDRRTGKPMPCRFHCYHGVIGKEHPEEIDPKTGFPWPAGCAEHRVGACPFFHPDEKEWDIIIGKVAFSATPDWRRG